MLSWRPVIKLLAPTLAASVLVVGAAACTDDDPDPAPTPTTTEPSTTTTTTEPAPTDEEAIEQLIVDWFEATRQIGFGDADVETAGDYLVDPYLTDLRSFIVGPSTQRAS